MTSHNNNTPAEWFQLVPEALHYLATKISALKEEGEEKQNDKEDDNIIIKAIISKDLDQNAQRIEEIARGCTKLIGPNVYEESLDYIDSNERIIRFAINVYDKDLRDSKKAIHETLDRIRGNSYDSLSNDKALFFKEFCKTENLDKLLANIKEFKDHNYGRKRRQKS